MVRRAVVFLLALASTGAAARAEAPSVHGNAATIAEARAYLDAYARLDLAALERLYAEDANFNDPTSETVPGIGGPFVWRGRAAILAGIGRWKQSVKSLNYEVERIYEASGHVVFVGEVRPVVQGDKRLTQYAYPIVTIVTIANSKVAEHRDYTNYAASRVVPAAP
jgi:ketosteroid isomerase-like protein